MQIGDKVVFKSNSPFRIKSLYILYSQILKGNIYTISAIFFDGTLSYEFLECEGYRFSAEWFIPYNRLSVLIERRRNV